MWTSLQVFQFLLLFLTSLLFAAGFFLGRRNMSLRGLSANGTGGKNVGADASMGILARSAVASATIVGAGLLVWRACMEQKLTLPLSNHFDAFLTLGLLLALVMMYFRLTRQLRALAFFMLPMISALLLFGLVLSLISPREYSYETAWTRVHVVSIVTGTVCFALACVGGGVYLLADRQLRRKSAPATGRWIGLPPLATIEKFNQWMVYLGFPLLTIALVAGVFSLVHEPAALQNASLLCKMLFAAAAWVVYGLLTQVPLAPSFRGQRAAWLSIIGFVLFIGGFVAANWMK